MPCSPPDDIDVGIYEKTDALERAPQAAEDATRNVLSLCGLRDDEECGLSGPSRQAMLLRQPAEEEITIFAFQETRLKRAHSSYSDDYLLFRSPATARGHYGILLGFAKNIPYARVTREQSTETISFVQEDFAVVHMDPRALLVRVSSKALKCIIVACHAPHTGELPARH